MFLSGDGEPRQQQSFPRAPWAQHGSSSVPLQDSVRGHTALRDSQLPQGWDCTVTRARQLLVTSPLPCKSHSEGDNNSFTEPRLYQHQHFIPAFIPCPPRACQEAQCPFSTDEPLLTVNFSPCVSLLTQHAQLPCFPPKEWDAL